MSAGASQSFVTVFCDAADNDLYLQSAEITEGLGELFELSLTLWTREVYLDLAEIVGQPLAVKVEDRNNARYFHGVVCELAAVMSVGRIQYYRAVVRPQLWTLGQRAGCRAFESKSVDEILRTCFGDVYGFKLGEVARSKVQFDHCVQYRESDLNFVSRMMERHGLYYFFEHAETEHTLHVAGGIGDHDDIGSIDFVEAAGRAESPDTYFIEKWGATTRLRSSKYSVQGTKNLRPSTAIDASDKTRFKIEGAKKLEVDDFEPVSEYEHPFLEELSRVRMEAIDATVEVYDGETRGLQLQPGRTFSLDAHPRPDQCKKYLVVTARHQIQAPPPPDLGGSADDVIPCDFSTAFTAIDAKTPFRPPARHRKPRVQGPQLATVVEETDKHGRVKVAFHWGSPEGDLVSFWSRVSHNWAGNQWGGMFLPHLTQEVIVEFVDGDPDQPLVTGRVYNEDSLPPLSLPADKQSSIIRDHGGNELMMDGTEGKQKIRLYCPSHESEIWLGKSIELKSTSDLKNFFTGNWQAEIGGDRSTEVRGGESKTIMKDVVENIIGNMKTKVGADVAQQKLGAFHETIAGLTSKWIGGTKKETVVGLEIKKLIGGKNETIEGAKHSDGQDLTETWTEAKKTIKGSYHKKAQETYTEVEKTIKQKANDYLIGAKMLKQDIEKEIQVKATDYKIGVEMLKQDVKKNYELKAKKAKQAIAGAALVAAAKFSVNDGNLDVKK